MDELWEMMKRGALIPADRLASRALHERIANEMRGAGDHEAMERFMAEHEGMTPIQWMVAQLSEGERDELVSRPSHL